METILNFDRVDEYGPQHLEARMSLDASETKFEEVQTLGEISIKLDASKGGPGGEYLVEGEVGFDGDLSCVRCLDPFPFANRTIFTVRYRPASADGVESQEVELAEGELDVEFYESRQIPLKDIALEQIGLTLPMKPLCEEACRGLCPQCGANQNRGECSCKESLVDDRWDALKGIREELARKKDV